MSRLVAQKRSVKSAFACSGTTKRALSVLALALAFTGCKGWGESANSLSKVPPPGTGSFQAPNSYYGGASNNWNGGSNPAAQGTGVIGTPAAPPTASPTAKAPSTNKQASLPTSPMPSSPRAVVSGWTQNPNSSGEVLPASANSSGSDQSVVFAGGTSSAAASNASNPPSNSLRDGGPLRPAGDFVEGSGTESESTTAAAPPPVDLQWRQPIPKP